jgi:outer membrane lipoprotein-sorting protein
VIIKNNARAYVSLFTILLVAVFVGKSAYAQGFVKTYQYRLTSPKARSMARFRAPQKSAGLAQQIAIAISDLSFDTLQSNITVTTTERKNVKQNTTWSGTFYWKRSEDDDRWFRIKFKDSGPDILVKGIEVKVYVPKINKIIETNLQTVMDKYPMYYFDPTEMLTGNYDLKLLPKRNGYTAIKAVPRESSDTEYAIISVTKVNGNYFPVKFEVVQKAITRTIALSNIKQPEEIADSLFQLNYPNAASMPIR